MVSQLHWEFVCLLHTATSYDCNWVPLLCISVVAVLKEITWPHDPLFMTILAADIKSTWLVVKWTPGMLSQLIVAIGQGGGWKPLKLLQAFGKASKIKAALMLEGEVQRPHPTPCKMTNSRKDRTLWSFVYFLMQRRTEPAIWGISEYIYSPHLANSAPRA